MTNAPVVERPTAPGFLCSTTIVFLARLCCLLAVLLVGCSPT